MMKIQSNSYALWCFIYPYPNYPMHAAFMILFTFKDPVDFKYFILQELLVWDNRFLFLIYTDY